MGERTIHDVLADLAPGVSVGDIVMQIAEWPPDAFAATSAILFESGAYRLVVSPPSPRRWPPDTRWSEEIRTESEAWRAWCETPGTSSSPASARVSQVRSFSHATLSSLCDGTQWNALCAILTLHALADECCANLGLTARAPFARYAFRANDMLATKGTLSRFGNERVRVLPKMRTPQAGISLRSLSLHAAFVRCEVDVHWHRQEYPAVKAPERLRLLLFPWPFAVSETAFISTTSLLDMAPRFGSFSFQPTYLLHELTDAFESTVKKAKSSGAGVDAAVLPECAVSADEYDALWRICQEHEVNMLVAGVRGQRSNEARLRVGQLSLDDFIQFKHHRWCLDGTQIRTYRIGSSLNPARTWWESADLPPRQIGFMAFNDWLTICHLVCEDLARIDPVAQVVRAVGPTLLIALLLDGPQLASRWSARYASVVADDPGTSVLTLTSLGMVERSHVVGKEPSRAVAFWKDTRDGGQEITLDRGATGLVLTLWPDWVEEFAADGRSDGGCAGRVILGGVQQIH